VKRRSWTAPLIRAGDRVMTFVPPAGSNISDGIELPSEAEINAALDTVPEDVTWDWVSPRLIPLFERGYSEGFPGDPMINTPTSLGVGIGFGIDFGPAFGRVTRSMAERWEASVEQIEHAAFAHLADVAASITRADLQSVVHQGHYVRALGVPAGWASSVVLAGADELIRIFGTRDVIFTAPTRGALLAFAPATPTRAIADVTVQLETADAHPLLLDAFVLDDGELHWGGMVSEVVDAI
jgi:hypothetical protein